MSDRQDRIQQDLRDAIETLQSDVTRVELWAYALSGFAQPVSDYGPDEKYRLHRERESAAKEL